jgi:hypothetical protein
MNKSMIIFESSKNNYKLSLHVYDCINDYKQHVFIAELRLYTLGNMLITGERYSFPKLAKNVNNSIILAHDFYLAHVKSRFILCTIAHDLYLKSIREGANHE